MPWQERSAMDDRESFVADYLTEMWTMTELCACYGISCKTGYKWVDRYRVGGRPALADRSRRPNGPPRAAPRVGDVLTIPTAPNHVWTTDFKGEFRLGDTTLCHPLTLRDG